MLGWLMLARTATSLRDSCLSLLDIYQKYWKNVIQQELAVRHVKWWVEAYSRYPNLLDDILASPLFGFHKDGLSKWAFPNFLNLFVLVHVTGEPSSACWVYKWGALVNTLTTRVRPHSKNIPIQWLDLYTFMLLYNIAVSFRHKSFGRVVLRQLVVANVSYTKMGNPLSCYIK